MKILNLSILITAFLAAPIAAAKPSINDMQGCQAAMDFLDYKMKNAPKKYPKADVKAVREGLTAYSDYLQDTVITPGLLEYNGGDKKKAKTMQGQVDAYKASVTASYKKRYPQDRVFMDHAVIIDGCAQKAMPQGALLETLKAAVESLAKLARME